MRPFKGPDKITGFLGDKKPVFSGRFFLNRAPGFFQIIASDPGGALAPAQQS
jgi:hypothetical protein